MVQWDYLLVFRFGGPPEGYFLFMFVPLRKKFLKSFLLLKNSVLQLCPRTQATFDLVFEFLGAARLTHYFFKVKSRVQKIFSDVTTLTMKSRNFVQNTSCFFFFFLYNSNINTLYNPITKSKVR